jgi:hypothetical protein
MLFDTKVFWNLESRTISRKSVEIYSCEMDFIETRQEITLKEKALQNSVQKSY